MLNDERIRRDIFNQVSKNRSNHSTVLLKLLKEDWPSSEDIIVQVYKLLYAADESAASDLMLTLIDDFLEAYRTAVNPPQSFKHDDPYRLAVFIRSVVDSLEDLMGRRTCSSPDVLSVWGDRERVYKRIASRRIQNIIRSNSYEIAILDRCVDLRP